MKIELKHLTPYLPYGLKIKSIERLTRTLSSDFLNKDACYEFVCPDYVVRNKSEKPILRPLSDLNDEKFHRDFLLNHFESASTFELFEKDRKVDVENLEIFIQSDVEERMQYCFTYSFFEYLLEWHFDIFGLIEKELAIDINTLKDEQE